MNSKSISAFFAENLNAPLANVQWSWGAENEKGVYLRIWAIEVDGTKGWYVSIQRVIAVLVRKKDCDISKRLNRESLAM